jgi:hypothetical protein
MIIHTTGLPALDEGQYMTADEYCYLIGITPPRYPVPAIVYHVYLPTPDECGSIWEYTRFECEPYALTYNRRVKVVGRLS